MNRRQFNIWVGAALLLAMLATCYVAIDAIYNGSEPPYLTDDYIVAVLYPS